MARRYAYTVNSAKPADQATEEAIELLGAALHVADQATYAHSARLVRYVHRIGEALNLTHERLLLLQQGAFLHDIGKLLVPEPILVKPGPLSEQEWTTMQRHPASGYRFVHAAPIPEPVAEIVLTHHEWYDGSGYPLGLKGTAISLEARICSVADMLDALTADRPYRLRVGFEEAVTEIEAESGSHFDPAVVKTLRSIPASEWIGLSRLDRLRERQADGTPDGMRQPHTDRRAGDRPF